MMTQKLKILFASPILSIVLFSSGFLTMLTPLPIVYAYVVRGRKVGISAALISLFVMAAVYLFASSLSLPLPTRSFAKFAAPSVISYLGLGYLVFYVAVALAIAEGALRKLDIYKMGALALGSGLFVAIIVLAASIMNIGVTEAAAGLKGYIDLMVAQVLAVGQSAGPNAQTAFVEENAGAIASFVMSVMPCILFVFALVAVVVNLLLSRRFIRSTHAFAHIHNVARFRLPDWMVWTVVLAGVLFFVDRYMLHTNYLDDVATNALIMFGAIYFFQGLAVAVYFIQRVRMPIVKILAYIGIIFFFQTVGMMIVALGVADVWADFRLKSWKARHIKT